MQAIQIDTLATEEPKRIDPRHISAWDTVYPCPNKEDELIRVLNMEVIGVLAAHVLAKVATAHLRDKVKYRASYPRYTGNNAVMDLEHKGIIYRHYHGLIYTKKAPE